jgi:fructose-bisphosphate aldolase class 1
MRRELMKYVLSFCLLFSIGAWAKTAADFNKALNDDVQKDIKKDEDKFKKREPASVETAHENEIQDTPKIDKNLRQIGPNRW